MLPLVCYAGAGDDGFAHVALVHTLHVAQLFRQASAAAVAVSRSHVYVAVPNKALLHVYAGGKELAVARMPVPETITALEVVQHPGSSAPFLLVGGGKSGNVYVWELALGMLLWAGEAHYQAVTQVACGGGMVVTAAGDGRVMAWRVVDLVGGSPKPLHIWTDHTLAVRCAAVVAGAVRNDTVVVSGLADGTVRMYNAESGDSVTTFVVGRSVACVGVDPAMRALYVGSDEENVVMVPLYRVVEGAYEAVGGAGRVVTVGDERVFAAPSVTALGVSPDGLALVVGDANGGVVVYDVGTQQVVRRLREVSGPVVAVRVVAGLEAGTDAVVPLARVVADGADQHTVKVAVDGNESTGGWDFAAYADSLRGVEVAETATTAATPDNSENAVLKARVAELETAYNELRQLHEQLYQKIGLA